MKYGKRESAGDAMTRMIQVVVVVVVVHGQHFWNVE